MGFDIFCKEIIGLELFHKDPLTGYEGAGAK